MLRKFGFGIFKEKPILPFDVKRDYRYDFEHLVNLTSDISEIVEKAPRDEKQFAGNLDNPESGLDALLQVCQSVNIYVIFLNFTKQYK